MSKQAISHQDYIKDNGILLPKWLFYSDDSKAATKSASPAAGFIPESAVAGGESMQTQSAPSKALLKKKLVLHKSSFRREIDKLQAIAIIERLRLAGFKEIFLCVQNEEGSPNKFLKVDDYNILESLKKISEIDLSEGSEDLEALAGCGVAYGKAVFLNADSVAEIRNCFTANKIRNGDIKSDGLSAELPLRYSSKDVLSALRACFASNEWIRGNIEYLFNQLRIDDLERALKMYFEIGAERCGMSDIGFRTILSVFFREQGAWLKGIAEDERIGLIERVIGHFQEKWSNISDSDGKSQAIAKELSSILYNVLMQSLSADKCYELAMSGKIKRGLLSKSEVEKLAERIPADKVEGFKDRLRDVQADEEQNRRAQRVKSSLGGGYGSPAVLRFALPHDSFRVEALSEDGRDRLFSKEADSPSLAQRKQLIKSLGSQFFTAKFPDIQLSASEARYLLNNYEGVPTIEGRNNFIANLAPEIRDKFLEEVFVEGSELLLKGFQYKVDGLSRDPDSGIAESQKKILTLQVPFVDNIDDKSDLSDVVAVKIDTSFYAKSSLFASSFPDGGAQYMSKLISTKTEAFLKRLPNLRYLILVRDVEIEGREFIAQYLEDRSSKVCIDYDEGFLSQELMEFFGVVVAPPLAPSAPVISMIPVVPAAPAIGAAPKDFSAIDISVGDGDVNFLLEPADTKKKTFYQQEVGRVLNSKKIKAKIRTKIITRDILNSLDEKEYVATKYIKHKTNQLTDSDLQRFSAASEEDMIFYSFAQSLTPGKRTRLLSAAAEENFEGINGDISSIVIERGDDDFFYATLDAGASQACEISYVISARNPKLIDRECEAMKGDSASRIGAIIKDYMDVAKGYNRIGSRQDVNRDLPYDKMMEDIFEKRHGNCDNRVAAVEYKLRGLGFSQQEVRPVVINNNHIALEVKYNDKWVKVDLGGGIADLVKIDEERAQEMQKRVDAAASEEERRRAIEEEIAGIEAKLLEPEEEGDLEFAEAGHVDEFDREIQELKVEIEREELELEIEKIKREEADLKKEIELRRQQIDAQEAKLASAKALAQEALKKALSPLSKIKKCQSVDALVDQVKASDNKILIITNQQEDHARFILQEARKKGRRTFYIDSPEQLAELDHSGVIITRIETEQGFDHGIDVKEGGILAQFLQEAADDKNNPLLLINWEAFTARQRTSLNSILDRKRTIHGRSIGANFQIIGFNKEVPRDSSFISRHNLVVESAVKIPSPIQVVHGAATQKISVDLQGFPNWCRQLFGKIILINDKLVWEKSDFVKLLESNETNFEILNISEEARAEFQKELTIAKARGFFDYHGYKIDVSGSLEASLSSASFDFSRFQISAPEKGEIAVLKNAKLAQVPEEAVLINTYFFDALLYNKSVVDGAYAETDGLIKEAANKTLKLFITSNLSQNQYYCLLHQAKESNVALELYLAPNVEMPPQIKGGHNIVHLKDKPHSGAKKEEGSFVHSITSTNDSEKAAEDIKAKLLGETTIIDVEDFSYQDLIERLSFEPKPTKFFNFNVAKSQILEELRAGRNIILKGEFSPDLFKMLEPFLAGRDRNTAGLKLKGKLLLVVDDKSVTSETKSGEIIESLKWLPYLVARQIFYAPDRTKTKEAAKTYREVPNLSHDLTHSKKESDDFIDDRKDNFARMLLESTMLQLVGHSGVGKSRMIKMFESDAEEKKACKFYRELSSFKDWANSREICEAAGYEKYPKFKVLFIDESNIEDLHFTFLAQLKKPFAKGEVRRIFYKGEFYDITEYHKVVFARNPLEYGGGRFAQKLFEDPIAEMHFADFPAGYIYEMILKEAIYDKSAPAVRRLISEEQFKNICQPLIEEYQTSNAAKPESLTVRELQEKVLRELSAKLSKDDQKLERKIAAENFISTSATADSENSLESALRVRALQRAGLLPGEGIGLNGVLLEGKSGIGKSELIEAVLESKGIKKIAFKEVRAKGAANKDSLQCYYKIDSSVPLSIKQKIILRAFHDGDIVMIDEVNSCIDDGLQKILNLVISGVDLEGNHTKNPGFMLVASSNSGANEGRSILGPDFRHRVDQPKVKELREYKTEDFEQMLHHWQGAAEPLPNISELAEGFRDLVSIKEGGLVNLRDLRSSMDKSAALYGDVAKEARELQRLQKNLQGLAGPSAYVASEGRKALRAASSQGAVLA